MVTTILAPREGLWLPLYHKPYTFGETYNQLYCVVILFSINLWLFSSLCIPSCIQLLQCVMCLVCTISFSLAFLALDVKVVIAGFREPLTEMRKPRYLYSHTMIMGAPFCCEKQTVFVSIKFTWRLQYLTGYLQKSGVSQDIQRERPDNQQRAGDITYNV